MNTPNPFSPPTAPVADVGGPDGSQGRLRTWRLVFCLLVAVHLAAALTYGRVYFELTRTGAVSGIAFLGAVLGALCLYTASAFVAWRRARGAAAFVAAAVFLGASSPAWGLQHVTGWIVAFGALLALCGAFLVRP